MKGMRHATILSRIAGFALAMSACARAQVATPAADSARMTAMADDAMSGMDMHAMSAHTDPNMAKHMALTPVRVPTHDDSVRALTVAAELKRAIAKYQDTAAAVADGYQMFLPNVKQQQIYHFTNYRRAFKEAFRFDPAQPTSILYKRGTDGRLHLVGAMYTMPQRASLDRLNERVPLSIARWHQHVNWCLPKRGESARYGERMADGSMMFGPESPIATRAACDAVGGEFHPVLFGWMLHANVYEGAELGTIFGDEPM